MNRLRSMLVAAFVLTAFVAEAEGAEQAMVRVGTFRQEVGRSFGVEAGLPDANVHAVAVTRNGDVYAGTENGLARLRDGRWQTVKAFSEGPVWDIETVAADDTESLADYGIEPGKEAVLLIHDGALYTVEGRRIAAVPASAAPGPP